MIKGPALRKANNRKTTLRHGTPGTGEPQGHECAYPMAWRIICSDTNTESQSSRQMGSISEMSSVGGSGESLLCTARTDCWITGFPDPFAVATVSGEQTKTTGVIKKTLNPYWNESFDM